MMELNRRTKYTGHKHEVNKSGKQIKLGFDLITLNILCSYAISSNKNIRRSHLINVRNLFSMLDLEEYSDKQRALRVKFIQRALEARLDRNLTDKDMIIKYINGGIIDDNLIDSSNFKELSNGELDWINGTVNAGLNYSFIYSNVDLLIDTAMKFKAGEYSSKDFAAAELESAVNQFHSAFRRNKAMATSNEIFSLIPGKFEEIMSQIHSELCNPGRKLRFGMVAWNEILKGGVESQRVYSIFGLPGEGKSSTLVDMAIQIKKYNKDYITKDPTKRPCVVYLTMENGIRETVERLWAMLVDREEMTHYSIEKVIEILRTEGELYVSDDNPIDIIIKYAPGESVDTSYMYTIVEDLEDDGYECICFLQDYLKKIRSVYNPNAEIRVQYGSVINEMKVFAILKDIPVITASQLNRDATKHIDEGRKARKCDLVLMLGRSNIGDSQLILENLDAGIFIAPEYDFNGRKWLGCQLIKTRFGSTQIESFYQPYTDRCPIKLVEDVDLQLPAYKLTMTDEEGVKVKFNTTIEANKELYNLNEIKEYNNIFLPSSDSANIYSSQATTNPLSSITGKVAYTAKRPGFVAFCDDKPKYGFVVNQ